MKTDDVKEKSKRIKRSYPRDEVYHRFIHDDTFIYSKENRYPVYVIGNYLLSGKPNRTWGLTVTNETIKDNWGYYSQQCLAFIDRDNKRIIINSAKDWHFTSITYAVPKDYEVFVVNENIPVPSISSTGELDIVLKLIVKTLITQLVSYLHPFYNVVYNNAKTIRQPVSNIDNYNVIKILNNLTKKYKLKSKDWYKESLFKHSLDFYNGWSYCRSINITTPSLKQVITNKIFTNNEKLLLEQRYFYTKYCYNRGISFKLVQDKWDKEFDKEWFEKECKRRVISIYDKINNYRFKECLTFKDGLKVLAKIIDGIEESLYEANRKKSEDNYNKALAEANKHVSVNDWREGKSINTTTNIAYQCWVPTTRTNCGKWVTRHIYNRFCFPTPKLKLNPNNENEILTSLGARVTLNSAILMWRYFNERVSIENPINKEIHIDLKQSERKVGIYPLHEIGYDINKYSDTIDWEWYVQIGCHKIYISDVVDFIIYYHLEEQFKLDNKLCFKLNIKQLNPSKLKFKIK